MNNSSIGYIKPKVNPEKQGHNPTKQTMPQSPKLTDQPRRWNEPWSPVFRLPTIESHSSCRCRGQASGRPRSCPYGTQRRYSVHPARFLETIPYARRRRASSALSSAYYVMHSRAVSSSLQNSSSTSNGWMVSLIFIGVLLFLRGLFGLFV